MASGLGVDLGKQICSAQIKFSHRRPPSLSSLGILWLNPSPGAIVLLTGGCGSRPPVGLFTQEPVRTLLSPSHNERVLGG